MYVYMHIRIDHKLLYVHTHIYIYIHMYIPSI
jgi:hypothetical protein